MENLVHPFSVPIYQNFINDNTFIKYQRYITQYINNNPESFSQAWNCPTLSTLNSPKETNINPFLIEKEILFHSQNYINYFQYENKFNLDLSELWVNVAQYKDFQEVHHHDDAFISGVIYFNTNDTSGGIAFTNPLSSESIMLKGSKVFPYKHIIKPQNGMILLFPSWMQHEVFPNKSNIDRISISFNLKINN